MEDLHNIRSEYRKGILNESNLPDNPEILFNKWLKEALNAGIPEATAMTLSTVNVNQPSSRIVLLKEYTHGNFVFYTNYESRKGNEILENPNGALNFFWPELERQVRVEGMISKTKPELSDKYFLSRPFQSQISAIISPQSQKIKNKEVLLEKIHSLSNKKNFDRPKNWGGYQLFAKYFEFWQGRENRLHDRFEFILENNKWKISRLAP